MKRRAAGPAGPGPPKKKGPGPPKKKGPSSQAKYEWTKDTAEVSAKLPLQDADANGKQPLLMNGQRSSWFKATSWDMDYRGRDLSCGLLENSWPIATTKVPKKHQTDASVETGREPVPVIKLTDDNKPTPPPKELETPIKTLKIKLQVRKRDANTLLRHFGNHRKTYNEAVSFLNDLKGEELRQSACDADGKLPSTKQFMRDHLVHKEKSYLVKDCAFLLQTKWDIRADAINQLVVARKAALTNVGRGNASSFKMGFRSRKNIRSESILVRPRWVERQHKSIVINLASDGPGTVFKTRMSKFPHELPMDCRLQRTWRNEYYLCIPQPYKPRARAGDTQARLRVCAMDPGVRTFQTIYDPSNSRMIEVGAGDYYGHVYRLCKDLDAFQSKIDEFKNSDAKKKSKRLHSYRRAFRRKIKRIRDTINEVHCQLAAFLSRSYDIIMLPSFETSDMVETGTRVFGRKTARAMLTWAHYRFRCRLAHKCRVEGSKLVIVSEHYTTRTCSFCGTLKHNVGGASVFTCINPSCGQSIGRDVNAAKNIFLKNFKALDISVVS